jgi:hypothetical protein
VVIRKVSVGIGISSEGESGVKREKRGARRSFVPIRD